MDKHCTDEFLTYRKADAIRLMAALGLVLLASQTLAVAQTTPQIFAPGIISGPAHDASPAFTPDGKTVFFSRSNTSSSTVLVSQRLGDSWSQPQIASFSGAWEDMEPTMSPDGSYLLFVSNRPHFKGDKAADGFYNGKSWPSRGSAVWRVDRTPTGWGEPHPLPAEINSGPTVFAPSVAGNGSVYFMKPDVVKNKFRLFRAHWSGHGFDAPEPLPFSTGQETDVDPAVAPDESFIVFGSGRAPAKDIDLFICFRDDGSWGTPIHLGDVVNSPGSDAEARLSPDHRTLYFASDRVAATIFPESLEARKHDLEEMAEWNNSLYNIWFVSLDPWLNQHQTQAK
jgi:WD40-like Beta Propeller Repeat